MIATFSFDIEDLKKVNKILNEFKHEELPPLTTRINRINIDKTPMYRLTIDGNDKDVKDLVDILTNSFFIS